MLLVKVLEIARKWARKQKANSYFAPIWVETAEVRGKKWVFITAQQLRLAVPGSIPQAFLLNAQDLPKPLKGKLVHEGAYFLDDKGAKKILPVVGATVETAETLLLYFNTTPPTDALTITLDAEEVKAVLVARSKDLSRPVLTGIGIHPSGAVVASDGYHLAASRSVEPFEAQDIPGVIFPDAFTASFAKMMDGQLRLTIPKGESQGQLRGFLKVGKERVPFLLWCDTNNTYPDTERVIQPAKKNVFAKGVVLGGHWPKGKGDFHAHLVGDPINNTIWVLIKEAEASIVEVFTMKAEKVPQWFWVSVNPTFLRNAFYVLGKTPTTLTYQGDESPFAAPFCFCSEELKREVVIMPLGISPDPTEAKEIWQSLAEEAKEAFGITLPEPEAAKEEEPAFQPEPAYA